ncbi:MAG TPA: dihydroneopterin aldolase [Candidatus Elarobacter sp.]|nr:dihydroneopterin aldolase [Candidatus Elarobacter sp.]
MKSVVTVSVRGIRAWGRHGANAGEQDVPQPIDVNVALTLRVDRARSSDDLGDTIDYAVLHARVVHVVESHRYRLLERLAGAILDTACADERVELAIVEVAKPGLLDGATPSVMMTWVRARGDERRAAEQPKKRKKHAKRAEA